MKISTNEFWQFLNDDEWFGKFKLEDVKIKIDDGEVIELDIQQIINSDTIELISGWVELNGVLWSIEMFFNNWKMSKFDGMRGEIWY